MSLTERQHLNRVSELPIEEVFTDLDVNRDIVIDKAYGYRYEYPSKFVQTVSNNKVIGIRRLEVVPTSHVMKFYIRGYDYFDPPTFTGEWTPWREEALRFGRKPHNWFEGTFTTESVFIHGDNIDMQRNGESWTANINFRPHQFRYRCVYEPEHQNPYAVYIDYRRSTEAVQTRFVQVPILVSILEENSLEEIVHKITDDFNSGATRVGFTDIKLTYEYDNQTGIFAWTMNDGEAVTLWELKTTLFDTPDMICDSNDLNTLLRFFNQDDGFRNYRQLVEPTYYKGFDSDVWDRKRVQFHATFSDARNKYIGSNGDHFDAPSKLYRYVLTDPMFYIRFTTNGRTNFIPRYCSIIIELCFILNYQRTVLLD
jgi:hypothetical protein